MRPKNRLEKLEKRIGITNVNVEDYFRTCLTISTICQRRGWNDWVRTSMNHAAYDAGQNEEQEKELLMALTEIPEEDLFAPYIAALRNFAKYFRGKT